MIKLTEIFEILEGNGLDGNSNKVIDDIKGIPLISRTKNNIGSMKRIRFIPGIKPFENNTLTFSPVGNACATFLQTKPFYTTQNIKILKPILKLSLNQLLYYKTVLSFYEPFFHYGRTVSLDHLNNFLLPSPQEIPLWVNQLGDVYIHKYKSKIGDVNYNNYQSYKNTPYQYKNFFYSDIFHIERGKNTKSQIGNIPYISATSKNNGISFYTKTASYPGNQITLSNNGSIGEAFYQNKPFAASSDVFILSLKNQTLNLELGIFLCTLMKQEKTYFHYGRKWRQELMSEMTISLPHQFGHPDWVKIKKYIYQFNNLLDYTKILNF